MKAILTGFEPFGNYRSNPTQDLALRYHGKKIGDIEVVGLVLPALYYEAFDELCSKIDEVNPDIILSTGLASRARKFRLELVGMNRMDGKYPDAKGRDPEGQQTIPGGKDHYEVNSNPNSLADVLNENGFPAELSVDAEDFICESLIYLTSGYIRENGIMVRNAFLHTPWTKDYLGRAKIGSGKITIKKQDLNRAVELLLAELGRQADQI